MILSFGAWITFCDATYRCTCAARIIFSYHLIPRPGFKPALVGRVPLTSDLLKAALPTELPGHGIFFNDEFVSNSDIYEDEKF